MAIEAAASNGLLIGVMGVWTNQTTFFQGATFGTTGTLGLSLVQDLYDKNLQIEENDSPTWVALKKIAHIALTILVFGSFGSLSCAILNMPISPQSSLALELTGIVGAVVWNSVSANL